MVRIFFVILLVFLAGCKAAFDRGTFDVDGDRTGKVDKNGFPVVVGARYDRDVPLKQREESVRLESELKAIAEARKNPSVNVDKRRDELLQQRLRELAKTHSQDAEAEIEAACQTDDDGIVHCKGD